MSSNLIIKSVITDAHHPRSLRASTLNEDDRLQVVCNLYTDKRYANSKVRDSHAQVNLVFTHGVGFSKDTWNYMVEKFFDSYGEQLGTVVAIDAVNHCDSYVLNKHKLGWVCSWEDQGRDVIKVLSELELKGGTILIGHSMGGAAALHAAALEKRLVDSVVAIEPVCFMDRDKYLDDAKERNRLYRLLKALNSSFVESFPSAEVFDKFHRKKYLTKTMHPRVLDDLLRANLVVDQKTGEATFKTPKRMQLSSYGSAVMSTMYMPKIAMTIDCEVCHVIGADASWNPPQAAPTLRANLPYCTAIDVPKGQHLLPLEMPDETFAAIQPFIEKRMARIKEIASEDYGTNPNTNEEREEYFWAGVDKVEELFTSGKKVVYSRL